MDLKKITDFLNLTTPEIPTETTIKPLGDSDTIEPQIKKFEPTEELLSWRVELNAYKIPKKIIRSGFVFIFLFCIFLVLARDWMLLLLILGFVFVINILTKTSEKNVMSYKIYSNGFDYCGTFYPWEELTMFFYYEGSQNEIVINTKDSIPGRIYVHFKDEDKSKVDSLLNRYLTKSLVHPKDLFELVIFKIKPYLNLSDEK